MLRQLHFCAKILSIFFLVGCEHHVMVFYLFIYFLKLGANKQHKQHKRGLYDKHWTTNCHGPVWGLLHLFLFCATDATALHRLSFVTNFVKWTTTDGTKV